MYVKYHTALSSQMLLPYFSYSVDEMTKLQIFSKPHTLLHYCSSYPGISFSSYGTSFGNTRVHFTYSTVIRSQSLRMPNELSSQ